MMVETGRLDALAVLARAASIIAEAKSSNWPRPAISPLRPDDYDQVIRAKTATLFRPPPKSAPWPAVPTKTGRAALRDYGMELGLAFQLVDDVLDYRGESGAMGRTPAMICARAR